MSNHLPVSPTQTPPLPAKLPPYATLEAWRGFASLWVVMFHTTHALTVRYPVLGGTPIYAFSSLGSLGVQIFFVISGYCIATAACNALSKPDGFRRFLQARAKRIYPPFWFAWTLAAGFSAAAGWVAARRHLGPSYSALHDVLHEPAAYWISNLTLTQVALHRSSLISPTWTLCYEVGFYLAAGLVLLIPAAKNSVSYLNTLHALTAAALLVLALAPRCQFFPLDLWPQFGLGVVVYDLVRHPAQRRPRLWLAGFSALVVAIALRPGLPSGPEHEVAQTTFSVALGFALTLWALRRFDERLSRTALVRMFASVGLFSYSLYLIHMLVIGIVNQGVHQLRVPEGLHLVQFWLTMTVSVAAGWGFYFFCERPFVKPLRRAAGAAQPPTLAGQNAE